MEMEGIQLKAFHPYGTRSPEQLEQEAKLREEEELEKLKQRTSQREEREEKYLFHPNHVNFSRRKSSRRKMREARERERWEGVLKGIEEKVNQEYGFQKNPKHEPTQTWKPMDEDSKEDFEERMTRHGYHSIGLGESQFT